ncbi:MAG: ribonuclease P protein component [Gemmatimonadetes bacterium]|nr:MAG: ribonuclease P protein component [Gemmatimonadota bacterium]PHX96600.1 MAG: ribonuclease P protein component [Gemmatimonadota bacterium]
MTRGADLAHVRARGKPLRGSALEIRVLSSTTTTPRVGIIVPRHSHTAVERNLVKRRLREIIRICGLVSPTIGTMVVFARPAAYRRSYESLRTELTGLCERAAR